MNLMNFRDLGGMKTACGRTVAPKRLLRAAQPVHLTEEERATLTEFGLKSIIDFRTILETEKYPVDIFDGVEYKHIDIMGENNAQAAAPNFWEKLIKENPAQVGVEFMRTYKEFAISVPSRKGYGDFVRACIAQKNGAVLFHCAAGKDRTGFAAAIVLRLLGVSDDDIFEDYLKSKEYQKKFAAKYSAKAKAQGMTDEQIAIMEDVFELKADYLKVALGAAEEAFDGFEGYVMDGLGLAGDEIAELKELYLARY